MKKSLKGLYLLVSSFVIALLHLPSAFAKPIAGNRLTPKSVASTPTNPDDSLSVITNRFKSVYDSLHLDLAGLSKQAFTYAQKGWTKLVKQGKVINQSVMAIVDFSQSSDQKRLYVLCLLYTSPSPRD